MFYQFRNNLANVYFLLMAIIQSIPEISALNPATAICPLVFVIFVSMGREAYEDFFRNKADK